MAVARSGFRLPSMTNDEMEFMERAIVGWGKALRNRIPRCGREPMSCGGACSRFAGHEPPCWCEGIDENGEETCPA